MSNENKENIELTELDLIEQKKIEYQDQLDELRKNGVNAIKEANYEIRNIKSNKTLSDSESKKLINEKKENIKKAKIVAKEHQAKVSELTKQSTKYLREKVTSIYQKQLKEASVQKKQIKAELKDLLSREKVIHQDALNKINEQYKGKLNDKKVKAQYNIRIKNEKLSYKNAVAEHKSEFAGKLQKVKDVPHKTFMKAMQANEELRNGKNSILEKTLTKFENYIYKFNLKEFLMKNGLYIIIFMFMIICIINNPTLIGMNSIFLILKNFSTKIFFALGVAGLILFGGTDLSVGRMVTMGSLITCILLNPTTSTTIFGISLNGVYAALGFPLTAILALVLSILSCVIFSAIAGYFTSKFKIHPFITTLGTSLIIWGLVGFGTDNVKTGTVTNEASGIVSNILGGNGFVGIPLTLFYAIIAIAITWFIWNKTKFGKNMYAVGGNSEAAKVSGISVIKTTMGIFILAAVLYGFGAFFQGLTTGSSSSTLGQGWELEAIAACVVGGISFSGGIGKISGAVIGCLLFEILKYYLRDITGGSADITNIFIGLIIIVAVTFDSIKYLKKK